MITAVFFVEIRKNTAVFCGKKMVGFLGGGKEFLSVLEGASTYNSND